MKIGKWGEMSRGETSFGEKRRTCANFGKKRGEIIFGEKRRREKCLREKCLSGRNVFLPVISNEICAILGKYNFKSEDDFTRFKIERTLPDAFGLDIKTFRRKYGQKSEKSVVSCKS